MHKNRLVTFFLSLLIGLGAFLSHSTPAQAATTPGLSVSGVSLVQTDGTRFVIAGVNMEYFRDPGCTYVTDNTTSQATAIVATLKSIKVNAVRLNYSDSWVNQGTNFTKYRAFMKLLAQNGIYVMPSTHTYTGKVLSGYQTTAFPTFQKIVEGARADGIEQYLIMNPYNEPYGENESASTWSAWITANKATLDYLRTTLNFRGVVVLDTKDWAANFDVTSMKTMVTYDASINNGKSNVVFSNHWYPNINLSNVDNSITNSNQVPVLIGEVGQYNATPLDPNYVKSVFSKVLGTGVAKGHNGIFPWIWSWCDDNNMTADWDDLSHTNAFGQLIVDNYYSKVPSGGPVPTVQPTATPTPTPSGTATPSPASPTPTPSSTPGTGKQLTLTQPVVLSPANNIVVGTTVTATAKYRNDTSSNIVVQDFVLSGRPPGGTNDDGPYLDFTPHRAGLTMTPGQEVTITATKTFTSSEPTGNWYAYAAWKDNTGFWVDAPSSVDTHFTVLAAGSTPQPTASPTPNPTQIPASECSKADINQDGNINLSDYSILVANFFKSTLTNPRADINGDGKVDLRDFSVFVRYVFKGCTPTSPAPSPSSTPSTGAGLKVTGTKLTTNSGARFVVSGANVEMYRDPGCSDISTGQYAARTAMVNKMKSLGINAVRLNYSDSFIQQSGNLTKFLDVMQLFAQQGIYVMPSTHTYTGSSLSGRSASYPLFKQIVEGARARGIEQYLIMNPYNEPGPQDSWAAWVTANKDTLNYLRNTANFKGVVVMDTISWAAAWDDDQMLAVRDYDATLMGGTAKVVFSNHWYPNISMSSVTNTINTSDVVPVVIGELGQINPGSSPLTPSYVTNVLNAVLDPGIAKGHNGVFAWMWNWCDENSMTNDDYTTLNTFGNLINNNYYKKLLTGTGGTSSPTPVPTVAPSPTPMPTPTPSSSPTPVPTGGATTLGFSGTKLTNNGSRFIINGVNLELYRDPGCSDITTGQYAARTAVVAKMKSLGINAVRVNYSDSFLNQSSTNLTKFLDVMQLLAQQGIYVMPSTHTYTGSSLSGSSASNATFKKIIDGVRARGFENMLIMNPFNEPGPDDSWAQWVTYNKATVTYLRNTAGFKGLIVLDGLSWAADFNTSSYQQMVTFDAGLMGGTAKIMFSNHWYPNIGLSPVTSSVNNSATVPVVIGELGQINPGSSGLEPQYVKDVFNAVLNGGTAKGHNGIFNWIWNWCDENGMTNDDYTTLNTFGNLVNTNYLAKPK